MADCGAKACPGRLTGPELYWHSLPDGSFTDSDPATEKALKRASCQSKPQAVVVAPGGQLNSAQTAKNLVCARAYGATSEALTAELTAQHTAICGDVVRCPLQTAFEAWLTLPLAVDLSQAASGGKP